MFAVFYEPMLILEIKMDKCFLLGSFGQHAHCTGVQNTVKTLSFTAGSCCSSSSHCAELQELLISVHSTPMSPTSTSLSACLPCLCCSSYFIGLFLVNGLVLLHVYVAEELQCLVGCRVEWAVGTDRTESGEAPEAVGQVVGRGKARCF